jgi:hypothetical protein
MKKIYATLCLLVAVVTPLMSQGVPHDQPKKERGRLAFFIYTSLPEGVDNPMKILSGTAMEIRSLSKYGVSEPVKIDKDGILRVVKELPVKNDPNLPPYITLAQAQVGENVQKALIILMPLAKPLNGLLFQTKVIDLADFQGGDGMFMNFTKLDIGVELGEDTIVVKPSEMKIHRMKNIVKPTNVPIKYSFYEPKAKEWLMITASTVVIQKTRREICIFSWDTKSDRIDYHGITFPIELE